MASLRTGLTRAIEAGKTSFSLSELGSTDTTNFVEAVESGRTKTLDRIDFLPENVRNLVGKDVIASIQGKKIDVGDIGTTQDRYNNDMLEVDFNTPNNFGNLGDLLRDARDSAVNLSISSNTSSQVSNNTMDTDKVKETVFSKKGLAVAGVAIAGLIVVMRK